MVTRFLTGANAIQCTACGHLRAHSRSCVTIVQLESWFAWSKESGFQEEMSGAFGERKIVSPQEDES